MDRGMINLDASFGHHLFQIPQAQAIGQIPADAEQDHRAIEMTAFEHHASPELAGGIGRTELPGGLRQFLIQQLRSEITMADRAALKQSSCERYAKIRTVYHHLLPHLIRTSHR